MKYNFFLDIDGTMTIIDGELADDIKNVITEARKDGHQFFVNSGRTPASMNKKTFSEEYFDGIVSGGGTHIVYHGELIYKHVIKHEYLRRMLQALFANSWESNITFEGTKSLFYDRFPKPWFDDRFRKVSKIDDFDTIYKDDEVLKFSTSDNRRIPDEIKAVFSEWFHIIEYNNYNEGLYRGHNKGKAIKILEDHLGFSHESTVAIGDSLNDIHMLDYAAISVAMGNAPDEIKENRTFVTDTVKNCGVARAIEKILNKN